MPGIEYSQHLFARTMEKLSARGEPYVQIQEILVETCDFFKFGCGFVYVAGLDGRYNLSQNYSLYENKGLKEQLDLRGLLGDAQMQRFTGMPSLIIRGEQETGPLENKLRACFAANLLVLIPVADQDRKLIGVVGVCDRRSDVRLSDEEFSVALSVLMVLANQIKLHIYQMRVESTRKALESMLDNMGVDIYVNDFITHEVLYTNHSMALPYGGKEVLIGRRCWEALYEDKKGQCEYCPQKKLIDEEGNPTKIYSWDYQRPFDGSWFRVLSAAFEWVDGRLAHVVSSVDITENKRNEELILRMAEIDELTRLPNRRKLIKDLDAAIKRAAEEGSSGYALFFDLDDFKKVNDELGHKSGDELLMQLAARMEEEELTKGHIYRHAGDEFVLMYENIDRAQVDKIVHFMLKSSMQPWALSDGEVRCRCSVGIASFPSDGDEPFDILHKADLAMYASKRHNKGSISFYNGGEIETL